VTGPVWDGQGTDPWLPARLDARLEAAQAEREVRAALWAALSEWLVITGRRVMSGGERPDLDAIWARVPAWREAIDHLLSGAIWKAIAVTFRRLLGDEYRWDQRAFIVGYLAEVRNRLVRIPDEVYDLVAGQLANGIGLGEGIPELAKRVDIVLSTTESERWPNRATVIARTETIGAMNAGRFDAFRAYAEETGETDLQQVWLATDDRRTRPTHDEADGQRVPLGDLFTVGGFSLRFPGDPTGPPQEVIQCRCTLLLVDADEDIDLSNRQMKR
jgi:Phage Mu protein F like protein